MVDPARFYFFPSDRKSFYLSVRRERKFDFPADALSSSGSYDAKEAFYFPARQTDMADVVVEGIAR